MLVKLSVNSNCSTFFGYPGGRATLLLLHVLFIAINREEEYILMKIINQHDCTLQKIKLKVGKCSTTFYIILHKQAFTLLQEYLIRRMLKAPPLIPRTYISQASNTEPTEGH